MMLAEGEKQEGSLLFSLVSVTVSFPSLLYRQSKYDILNVQPANWCTRKIAIVPDFYEANHKLVMEMQSQYALMKL
jgi:hypothetical protein